MKSAAPDMGAQSRYSRHIGMIGTGIDASRTHDASRRAGMLGNLRGALAALVPGQKV